jgi:hypothetical protein
MDPGKEKKHEKSGKSKGDKSKNKNKGDKTDPRVSFLKKVNLAKVTYDY